MPPPACVPLPSTHLDRPYPPANLCELPELHTSSPVRGRDLPFPCVAGPPSRFTSSTPRRQHAPSPSNPPHLPASPPFPVLQLALREPPHATSHGHFHVAATCPFSFPTRLPAPSPMRASPCTRRLLTDATRFPLHRSAPSRSSCGVMQPALCALSSHRICASDPFQYIPLAAQSWFTWIG